MLKRELEEIESFSENEASKSHEKASTLNSKAKPKSISTKIDNKTAWLRSLKRLGDTVENEYKIIKRLDINSTEDWRPLEKSLSKFEKLKEMRASLKKRACGECTDLLFRGLGTDLCRKRRTRKHNT
eukprot:TRINITY_DN10265_c0_g1_i2.p2 TRINITY_DN10265_c0_g1~~TRINITY_DN10265_c0_g1_i2.p2  ORF type:complete len:127 (-),score=23.12 TRINITY_DN10265_c0_g1_i2:54-434(-)